MGFLKVVIIIFFFSSCAKFQYIWNQGSGQLNIFYNSKLNSEILKNTNADIKIKNKIQKVEKFKKYFFSYMQEKEKRIYSKTTILDQDAVTYLVIASKFNEIKAKNECFWFIGCFPYLGFFDENAAKAHAVNLEKEDYVTYVRPVYAYSTLGYFSDPILSSFFHFDDFELAELIFHEIFHSIFFVKNEVDLNENLANFFGAELAYQYFKISQDEKKNKIKEEQTRDKLNKYIVELVKELKEIYTSIKPKTKLKAQDLLDEFLGKTFMPSIKNKCKSLSVSDNECYPLKKKWNNARFAAFLTYSKSQEKINKLFIEKKLSLVDFYRFLNKEYAKYLDEDIKISFEKYLFKENM